ncbi:MAG: alcohol dehydrogenase catalytic domain-containing protein [Hadesarchaea archaeon]|nr:alcohol dehydrogenase catalytic domain-containing protein [Hadesarchaea archaeon]
MKAVRYYGPNKPLRIEDIDLPKIGDDEVLVKVKAAGICHTDLHFLDGTLVPWKGTLPITLGHEIAGEIEEVGEKVKNFKKGDRVVLNNNKSCGKCEYCKAGMQNLCDDLDQHGFTIDGGYAEYVKTVERTLVKLPNEVPFEKAAVLPCAVGSVYHGLVDQAKLKAGESLLINGFGGLGTSAFQVAKHLGAKVFVVDVSKEKLKMAEEMGADGAVDGTKPNVSEEIKKMTGGKGVNVALELVGLKKTMENALNSLAKTGRYVIIGYTKDLLEINPLSLVVGEFRIIGSVSYTQQNLIDVVELARMKKITPVVSKTVGLDEVPDVLNQMKEKKIVGRVVARP